jgi:hypothetical protein
LKEPGDREVVLNMKMPPDLTRRILESAKQNDRSVAAEVRTALAFYLQAKGAE